jgi:hypothetical protein
VATIEIDVDLSEVDCEIEKLTPSARQSLLDVLHRGSFNEGSKVLLGEYVPADGATGARVIMKLAPGVLEFLATAGRAA